MTPRRLTLHNFMSYHDQTVDFSGLHLACLCGANGHGKSALLDAMTFALWGEARKAGGTISAADGLLRAGAAGMKVVLDFALDGQVYTVSRGYSKTGRSGSGELSFLVGNTPLTGNSIKVTQATIDRVLRMSYETFTNSAFILQGRADEFTRRSASERKAVLAEILDLSRYNELQDVAKVEVAAAKQEIMLSEIQMGEAERTAGEKETVATGLQACRARVVETGEAAAGADWTLAALREAAAGVTARNQQRAAAKASFLKAQGPLLQRVVDRKQFEKDVAGIEATLARRAEVEQTHAGYQETCRKLQAVEGKAGLDRSIRERLSKLRVAESSAVARATTLEARMAEEVQRLKKERGDPAALAEEAKKAAENVSAFTAHRENAAKLVREISEREVRQRAIVKEREANALELAKYTHQIELLLAAEAEHATCPLCQSPLDEESVGRVGAQIEEQANHCRLFDGEKADEALNLAGEIAGLYAAREEAERHARALNGCEMILARAQRALEASGKASEGLALAEAALEDSRRSAEVVAAQWKSQVEEAESELAEVGYDAQEHASLSRARSAGERSVAALEALRQAEASLGAAKVRLQDAQAREQEASQIAQDARSEMDALGPAEAEDRQAISEAERQANALRTQHGNHLTEQGTWELRLRRCQEAEAAANGLRSALEARRHRLTVLEALVTAYGREGIQALIIERTIPDIEAEANAVLEKLTGGKVTVRLESLRELKKGGSKETLDIHISDELGERSYEMFSGGEAFRINFALRIGLSKLLARRAGVQMRTLVLDEGFGTQDSEGLERLVEAIQSVADEFDLVLVITHVDSLKAAFPAAIQVTKHPQTGSTITVRN